ncbi:MAG: HD domain-containing protein [Candidatus Jordarchaeum sp.]|uniref:HD domain-containing protein n=1 Tax=Candidatus Jordarchaeum sp. TaxID=2823881 RepID=UPI00404AB7E2
MINSEHLLRHLLLKANEQKWYQLIAKWKRYSDSEGLIYGQGQKSLLAHSVATAWTAYRIADIIKFSEEDQLLALASGFLHDVCKARDEFQSAAESGSKKPENYHHHRPEQVQQDIHLFLEEKGSELPNEFENKVYGVVMALEVPENLDQLETLMTVSVNRRLVAAVALADELESIKTLDNFKRKTWGQEFENNLKIIGLNVTYHEIGVIRGVITQLLHDAFHKAFEKNGFHHIMYFPTGTVYIHVAEGEYTPPTLEQVKEVLIESINEMVKNLGRKLGPKAFGSLNAAHFKAPEYLYTSEEAIGSFWAHIFERVIPRDFSKIDLKEDTKKEIKKLTIFPDLSDDERRVYCLQLERITRTCILMADIIKHAIEGTGQDSEVMDLVRNAFVERFSVKTTQFLDVMMGMALQKSEIDRILFAKNLVEACGLADNLRRASEDLREFFIDLTRMLAPKAKNAYSIDKMIEGNIDKILEEVVYPNFGRKPTEIAEEAAEAYLRGKKKGTPLCAFCGREATETAVAGRFGSGSESFHNFLPGGTVISGENKVRVCDVCTLESKLKLLMLEKPSQMLILAPQLKLDGYTAGVWWNACQQLANQWGSAKGKGLEGNYLEWAKAVSSGKGIQALPEESKIVEMLTKDERAKLKKIITKILEDKENGPLVTRVLSNANYGINDLDALVHDFLNRSLERKLESVHGGREIIENIRVDAEVVENAMPVFISPNFMMILLSNEIRDYKESDTSAKLRQVFIGTVLGKVFQSCVSIMDDVNELIIFTRAPEGYLQIPRSSTISDLLSRYGIDPGKTGWLAIQHVETVLQKFSAMILIEKMLRDYEADYGRNTLLKISETIPGEILNRLTQSKRRKIKREDLIAVIEYLNIIEN